MGEQYDPGRLGFRDKLRGPFIADALTNELAIMERYTERWSRLWAISYDPSQITPDHMTPGWWLLAEFESRDESRIFCLLLHEAYNGATQVRRRRLAKSEKTLPARVVVACPECGCRVIRDAGDGSLVCDDCGQPGRIDDFRKEVKA
jgi:hypothetical protein